MISATLLLVFAIAPTQVQYAFEVVPGIYQVARAAAFAYYDHELFFATKEGHIYNLDLWNTPLANPGDVQIGSFDRLYDHSYGIDVLSVSADGSWLAAKEATGDERDGVLVFELRRSHVPRKLAFVGMSGGLVFEADGAHALTRGLESRGVGWQLHRSGRYHLESGREVELSEPELLGAGRSVGIGALGRADSQYLYPEWNAETESVDLITHPDGVKRGSLPRSSVLVRLFESGSLTVSSWAGLRVAVRSEDRKTINVFSLVDASLKGSVAVPSGVWCQEFWMLGENLLLTNSDVGTQFWDLEKGSPIVTFRMYFDGLNCWILFWDERGRYHAEPQLPTRLPLPAPAKTEDTAAIAAAVQRALQGMTEPRLHNDFWSPLFDVLPPKGEQGRA